jgi:hypothetical protein
MGRRLVAGTGYRVQDTVTGTTSVAMDEPLGLHAKARALGLDKIM